MNTGRLMFLRPTRFRINQVHLEWLGSATGLFGSALLSANIAVSGYGFLAFLVSNVFWSAFALRARLWGMLLMQVGFTVTSVIGVCRWLM